MILPFSCKIFNLFAGETDAHRRIKDFFPVFLQAEKIHIILANNNIKITIINTFALENDTVNA